MIQRQQTCCYVAQKNDTVSHTHILLSDEHDTVDQTQGDFDGVEREKETNDES